MPLSIEFNELMEISSSVLLLLLLLLLLSWPLLFTKVFSFFQMLLNLEFASTFRLSNVYLSPLMIQAEWMREALHHHWPSLYCQCKNSFLSGKEILIFAVLYCKLENDNASLFFDRFTIILATYIKYSIYSQTTINVLGFTMKHDFLFGFNLFTT